MTQKETESNEFYTRDEYQENRGSRNNLDKYLLRLRDDYNEWIDKVNVTDKIARGALSVPASTIIADEDALLELGITDIDIRGWTSTVIFSATDYNTVQWTGGVIVLANGTSYAIDAGNTGTMTAQTYIYLDGDSEDLLYTTTASESVGHDKILVAVAKNNTDTASDAVFQVFGGYGGALFSSDNIASNTITTNEIAVNAVTANQINVSTISSIKANLGTITAGTLNSVNIFTDEIYDVTYGFSGVFCKTLRIADVHSNSWFTLGPDRGGLLSVTVNYTTDSDGHYKLLPSYNTATNNSYYRVQKNSGNYQIYLERDDINDDISGIDWFYVTAYFNSNESASSF